MAQVTLAEAPEASLALSWLLVVVSMAAFSALTTSPPRLEPAGAVTAPQPATSKSSNGVAIDRSVRPGLRIAAPSISVRFKAVSQLLRPDKDREVWFSLEENHEKGYRAGLHPLRNCRTALRFNRRKGSRKGLRQE